MIDGMALIIILALIFIHLPDWISDLAARIRARRADKTLAQWDRINDRALRANAQHESETRRARILAAAGVNSLDELYTDPTEVSP